jgi:creatinine amidohydrolase/Fe(II)-dependent formamide hydrolase-like protein
MISELPVNKTELLQMSWREAEEILKKTDTAIVPIGATHGHGPIPVGVDTYTVDVLAKRVGEEAKVIVAPTLPYGYTEFNKDYAGAINISRETFTSFVLDICRSLNDFGVKKIILFNGHGGNLDSLVDVAYRLREERGVLISILEWWKIMGQITPEDLVGLSVDDMELAFTVRIIGKEMIDFENALERGSWTKKILGEEIIPTGLGEFSFRNATVTIPLRDRDIAVEESEKLHIPAEKLETAGDKILETLIDFMKAFTIEFKKVQVPFKK